MILDEIVEKNGQLYKKCGGEEIPSSTFIGAPMMIRVDARPGGLTLRSLQLQKIQEKRPESEVIGYLRGDEIDGYIAVQYLRPCQVEETALIPVGGPVIIHNKMERPSKKKDYLVAVEELSPLSYKEMLRRRQDQLIAQRKPAAATNHLQGEGVNGTYITVQFYR